MEIAIRGITSNPAKILKLKGKGRIEKNYYADLCLLDEESLDIHTVIAKGKLMVENKKAVVVGRFE